MKTLNLTLSDQAHEKLVKIKDDLNLRNLHEAIEEAILKYEIKTKVKK